MIRKEPIGKNMKREPILDRAAASNWGRAGESQLDRTGENQRDRTGESQWDLT